jgi:predicted RNase H-like nuclease (RuvC/YqgF family)
MRQLRRILKVDYETVEHIVAPIIAGLLGALAAWLKMSSDRQSAKLGAMEAQRDDRRDDFEALVKQQSDTIKRLDERVQRLEAELEIKDRELDKLRTDVSRFKLVYTMMRKAVLTECGHQDCPLWRYLDDRERDALLEDLLSAKVDLTKPADKGIEKKE